ncbi:jg756 [Pararge aegeria aegeria]|uniref:Jg756 protein n=1 Tax=Pararge aegeria aegeria TaxID=348720 RepID=A0A8S4S786_9NEOP|nr:jg756 [Pararge aegeria aegeria]
MEPEEEQKKLSDDMVVFLRKRSETDAPRYTAKLKTYVDFQQKRRRAAAARRNSEHMQCGRRTSAKKTNEIDQRDKSGDNSEQRGEDDRVNKKRGGPVDKGFHGPRSASHSNEPADRCPMRRRVGRRRRSRRLMEHIDNGEPMGVRVPRLWNVDLAPVNPALVDPGRGGRMTSNVPTAAGVVVAVAVAVVAAVAAVAAVVDVAAVAAVVVVAEAVNVAAGAAVADVKGRAKPLKLRQLPYCDWMHAKHKLKSLRSQVVGLVELALDVKNHIATLSFF